MIGERGTHARQLLDAEKAAYAKIEPPCPYFGACGGCALQDLAYPDQLALKRQRLQRALAGVWDDPIELVGLEDPWRYRNKAEFTFGESQGRLEIGFHARGSFSRIVDVQDCLLVPAPVMRILEDLRAVAAATGHHAYHARTHQGFFRHVIVRHSRASGRIMLCLITSSAPEAEPALEHLAEQLAARHPLISGIHWGWTDRFADVAIPDALKRLQGEEVFEDRLGPFRLQLHPLSFLQPTTIQAERLYSSLVEWLRERAPRVGWDLYCGIGVVGLYLSRICRQVYGIDVEAHHIEQAARNAALNGVTNLIARTGRVETLLQDRRFWLQEAKPDVVVVDPPRVGLHPRALSSILAARPETLVYCSCNAQALARDIRMLQGSFPRYRLARLRAFDMFPQTLHAEVLASFELQRR